MLQIQKVGFMVGAQRKLAALGLLAVFLASPAQALVQKELIDSNPTRTAGNISIDVEGAMKGNFQIDLLTDNAGLLVAIHFYGENKDKLIPLADLKGKVVDDLFRIDQMGDALWLKGNDQFDALRGGDLTATYISNWNLFMMHRHMSDFGIHLENQGGRWAAYGIKPDKSLGAPIKKLSLQVHGRGPRPAVGSAELIPLD